MLHNLRLCYLKNPIMANMCPHGSIQYVLHSGKKNPFSTPCVVICASSKVTKESLQSVPFVSIENKPIMFVFVHQHKIHTTLQFIHHAIQASFFRSIITYRVQNNRFALSHKVKHLVQQSPHRHRGLKDQFGHCFQVTVLGVNFKGNASCNYLVFIPLPNDNASLY